MKKQILIFAVSALAVSALAQTTNEFRRGRGEERPERPRKQRRPELSPEQKEKFQEHRLQIMEKALKKIGVTEEQKARIVAVQEEYREKMKVNMERSRRVRDKLTRLQDSGAPEEELASAIDEICEVQKEQLWILVRNRKEMERILGKEKYALFMDSARTQFRSHGRRGGSGLPPRPELPPMPNEGKDKKSPPLPPSA